jgi:hypothetical protein
MRPLRAPSERAASANCESRSAMMFARVRRQNPGHQTSEPGRLHRRVRQRAELAFDR